MIFLRCYVYFKDVLGPISIIFFSFLLLIILLLFSYGYKCRANFDVFNFDLPVTEIQLNHEYSRNSARQIELIEFGENMKKLPKFQKQIFKKSLPNSYGFEMNLNDDEELMKQLRSFLKRVDWIRKFEFDNLLIDEDSLNIFDEAKQMEKLKLRECKFPNDHLPARLFSKLTSLTYLLVESWNDKTKGIKTLDENVFLPLTNLVELDLVKNSIKTLPENLFQSLTKLEELLLNNNEIEILPQNLFKNNQNLQILGISWNKLKEIRVDFRTLPEISVLWLRQNDCINEGFKGTSQIHGKAEYIMNECRHT